MTSIPASFVQTASRMLRKEGKHENKIGLKRLVLAIFLLMLLALLIAVLFVQFAQHPTINLGVITLTADTSQPLNSAVTFMFLFVLVIISLSGLAFTVVNVGDVENMFFDEETQKSLFRHIKDLQLDIERIDRKTNMLVSRKAGKGKVRKVEPSVFKIK